MAGALLFDGKIRQSDALFCFGLRDLGILYSQTVIQGTIDVFPTFIGARFGGKDCGLSTCKP
jgi:hypothetical protein